MANYLSDLNVPYLSYFQIRNEAEKFRQKYWGNKIPVDIELIVEKELKLQLTPIHNFEFVTNSIALLSGNLKEIMADMDVAEVRLRFSVAHEVGHLVLHKAYIPSIRISSYTEWGKILDSVPKIMWARMEFQAHEFAGRLLVPRQNIISEIKHIKPLIKEAETIIDHDTSTINQYIAAMMCKKFGVADKTMAIRLEREKINPFDIISE